MGHGRLGSFKTRARAQSSVHSALAKRLAVQTDRANADPVKQTLEHLVNCCQGNVRPECPILDSLATPDAPVVRNKRSGTRAAGFKA